MKLYKVYNKNNIRNLFFNEKIIAPIYYDISFYNYSLKETETIKEGITLYSKIPSFLLKDSNFIMEIDIKLEDTSYIRHGIKYILLNNIYLDSEVTLKKIYYLSENIYKELVTDIALIGEAKFYYKYKDKFEIANKIKIDTINLYKGYDESSEIGNLTELIEIEKKKAIQYDSLKGCLYLITKFYPKFLIANKKEIQLSNKILNSRKLIRVIDNDIDGLKFEKNKIKKILIKNINNYRNQILSSIKRNKYDEKNSIFLIFNNNYVKINFLRTGINIKKNDEELINKIVNFILNVKLNNVMNNEKKVEEGIVKELGIYCKKIGDINLYNDVRMLYSILIKRDLNLNYKEINNEIIRFLYLALEYHNNISTLNSIISDYKFSNYFIIYLFAGFIIGFEKLNKIYTDKQKLDVFNKKIEIELKRILRKIDTIYSISNFYEKRNYKIIEKLVEEKNYYKMIDKMLNNSNNYYGFRMKRKSKNIMIINIYNEYKLILNKNITREFAIKKDKLNIKGKCTTNKMFNSFKYSKINGEKFKYNDEIKLNEKLKNIINNI